MRFGVLGDVAIWQDEEPVGIGGPKQRGLLAMLLLNANEIVPLERLLAGLWGDWPPFSAQRSLESYVSRLRAIVGSDRLQRQAAGYRLVVEPGELDVEVFESHVENGRRLFAEAELVGARDAGQAALSLWRGPALGDVLSEPFAAEAAELLEERRLLAVEHQLEVRLALGGGPELLAEVSPLLREHPLRERLVAVRMVALYRAGRHSDALGGYDELRRALAKELGLDPGRALQELQRRILDHDPGLEPANEPTGGRAPSRRSRRRIGAAALVGVLAVVVAVAVTETSGGSDHSSRQQRQELIELVSSPGAASAAALSEPAAQIAVTAGSLWLAEPDTGEVIRVDTKTRQVVDRVPVGGSPGAIAAGGGAVWVASVPGSHIVRVDPSSAGKTQSVDLGAARVTALAYGLGSLWALDATDRAILEISPTTGTLRRTIQLDEEPTSIAVGAGVLWVADYDAGSLAEIDTRTRRTVTTIRVGGGPSAIAISGRSVWVANSLDSTVSRIDPATASVQATIPVGSDPVALAAHSGSVWVASKYSTTLAQIDTRRGLLVARHQLNGGPTALAVAGGKLWVTTRPLDLHRGGTLILLHTRRISIDPALQLDLVPPVSDGLTRDGLVSYDHSGGPDGARLVPDLAISLPLVTGNGTTYSFRLRAGIRYSDGRGVKASDFRRAFERIFEINSAAIGYFTGIAGAANCKEDHCNLARGIATNDRGRTITFHLVAPDPQFLTKLTIGGLATPVPPGTPPHPTSVRPIAGTGPYEIEAVSRTMIRYKRNPYFHEWSHAAQPAGNPDQIIMRFGLTPNQEVQAVEHGRADWTADGVPSGLLPAAIRDAPSQLHSFINTDTAFLQLNTRLAPLDDVRVRKAINLAIDRTTIAELFGGREAATPTCQILPPGVLGYRRYCPYGPRVTASTGRTSSVATARALVASSGTRGERLIVWAPQDPTLAKVIRYVVSVLRNLGYKADAHFFPPGQLANAPERVFNSIQITPPDWQDSFPSGFFTTWLTCNAPLNHHWFCNRKLDRQIAAAQTLEAADPAEAASAWAHIDRETVGQAPWVPLVNPRQIDFVSKRAQNYQHHLYWGLIADQLTLR